MSAPTPSRVLLALLLLSAAGFVAFAENIDPDGDGSKWAYAENAGWLNADPLGGGTGIQVNDFDLYGWMWGENVGWISLSCRNTANCPAKSYGTRNDGHGVLSGYAWGENVGWVNMSPTGAGVRIDPATGLFSGRAWGENIGWVTFGSDGPNPYRMVTAWRCDPPPPAPSGYPVLTMAKVGSDATAELDWTLPAGATGSDIVRGDLRRLRETRGNFAASTIECLAYHLVRLVFTYSGTPDPGEGTWFLVRGANCGGNGTYDDPGGYSPPRDAGIAASGVDCP